MKKYKILLICQFMIGIQTMGLGKELSNFEHSALNESTFLEDYCIPYNENGNAHSAITKFSLANLQNTNQSPIFGEDSYSSFIHLTPAQLEVGQSYGASITAKGTGNFTANIWIDYNDDGVFSTTERVSTANGNPQNNWQGLQLNLPNFLVPNQVGLHRLRVQWVLNFNGNPNNLNPCNLINSKGETEDYMVEIVQNCPTELNISRIDNPTNATDCNLNYAKLTTIGGEIPLKYALFEDFSMQSNWKLSGPPFNFQAAYFNTNKADGFAPEGGLKEIGFGNNSGDWFYYPVLSNGDIRSFNVSDYKTLHFSFKHFINIGNINRATNFFLEVSNNGFSWVPIWKLTDSEITSDVPAATIELDLLQNPAINYSGLTTLYFRFHFKGDSKGLNKWKIDDVKIYGSQKQIKWSPTIGLFKDQALTIPYTNENSEIVYASPNGSQTYTAQALPNETCSSNNQITIERNGKTFNADNGNWSTSLNWIPSGIPTSTSCVIVPNGKNLIVNTNMAVAKSITVNSGGKLRIPSNNALTVIETINNYSTADDFVIESGGSLVQVNNLAVNTGPITVKRNFIFSSNRKQYNYVISPLIGQKIKHIYTNPPFVIYHKEWTNWFYNAGDGNYVAGRGLAIKEPSTTDVSQNNIDAIFRGIPFNGNLDYPITFTPNPNPVPGTPDYSRGHNLVGNPYPSNINLKLLYEANKGKIDSNFTFWDNRGNTIDEQQGSNYGTEDINNYAKFNAATGTYGTGTPALSAVGSVKTPTHILRPATAFMIRALPNIAPSGTMHFDNSIRVAANNGPEFFGKGANSASEDDRYWLGLTSSNNLISITAIVYFEGGRDELTMDDSETFGNPMDLYSMVDENQLSIQGKAPFQTSDIIHLGVRIFEPGSYTISIHEKEGVFANEQNIYIYDKKLQKVHNLTESDYSFDSAKGEFDNRFEIIYTPMTFEQDDSVLYAKGITFKKKDGKIEINSNQHTITKVKVFGLNNQTEFEKSGINSLEFKLDLNQIQSPIIILNVETENGKLFSKKFLN